MVIKVIRRSTMKFASKISLLVCITSCGNNEASTSSIAPQIDINIAKNFMAMRDSAGSLPASEMSQRLNHQPLQFLENQYFYADLTGSKGESLQKTCSDRTVAQQTQVHAKDNTLILEAKNISTSPECIKSLTDDIVTRNYNGVSSFSNIAKLDFKVIIHCQLNVDGVTHNDLLEMQLGFACGQVMGVAYSYQLRETINTLWIAEGDIYQQESYQKERFQFQMNRYGEPCDHIFTDNSFASVYQCTKGSYFKDDHPDYPKSDYYWAVSEDLKGESGFHPWYSQGSWKVKINDWEGSVSFHKNQQNPSFNFKSNGQEISGQLPSQNHILYSNANRQGVERLLKLYSLLR